MLLQCPCLLWSSHRLQQRQHVTDMAVARVTNLKTLDSLTNGMAPVANTIQTIQDVSRNIYLKFSSTCWSICFCTHPKLGVLHIKSNVLVWTSTYDRYCFRWVQLLPRWRRMWTNMLERWKGGWWKGLCRIRRRFVKNKVYYLIFNTWHRW